MLGEKCCGVPDLQAEVGILFQARLQKKGSRVAQALRIVVLSTIAAVGLGLLAQSSITSAFAKPGPSMLLTASEEAGYGRIVFNWPNGVPHHSEVVISGILVVTFDKPFDVNIDEFLRQMPHLAALVRQDPDKKTLRIGLKFDCWLNAQVAENSLYIDLMPSTWVVAPPPLPDVVIARIKAKAEAKAKVVAADKAAKDAGITTPVAPKPELKVRVASHEGTTRLVFDWNQPVIYSLTQKNGLATITFDRMAKVALAQIRVNPPPFLKTISSMEHDGRLSVLMKLDDDVQVSDFREDLGIVLDFKQQAADTASVETGGNTSPGTEKSSLAQPSPSTDIPGSPEPIALHVAAPETTKQTSASELPVEDVSTPEHLKIAVSQTENGSELVFPWTLPTGAAVFERAGELWVVFDRPADFDFSALDVSTLKNFGLPKTLNVERGSALVFPIQQAGLLVGADETGTSWHVVLANNIANTGRSVMLTTNWSASGSGYVSANIIEARRVIKISDPQVHDTFFVATARGATQSMQAARSFIEFQALKTAQGIAISPLADDLNVAAAPDAVIISRKNGLVLSADNDNSMSKGDPLQPLPAAMNFALWRGTGDFQAERQVHFKKIVMAEPADKSIARMDFGRFLLANRLAPEALTQFSLALKSNPELEDDSDFRALRGIGEVLAHRNRQAIADLNVSELELDPNTAGWRGLARVELGQMDQANKDFDFAGALIDSGDATQSEHMHLAAAKAALAMNDLSSAHAHLGKLPMKSASKSLMAEVFYLQGRLQDALKKPQEALNYYDRAIEVGDRGEIVRARFAKVLLQDRLEALSKDKVIAELNKLRMMWRGDGLELDILAELGKRELAAGKIVEALEVMRNVTTHFPASDKAQALGAKMPEIFADYFMGPDAKKLSALKALSFYYEFQDLTPIGQRGDELIRHLAERLVSIDLLTQAETLLKYQVDQRLHGSVAKAQVSARLAGIYLMDNKPADALKTLRSTTQNALPADLAEKRQLLEARAYASLKKYELALDLLSELDGPKVDELRAEIYWESKSWDAAGQASEVMADAATAGQTADTALSDGVRFNIMRSAIAYAMGNNVKGLSRLRDKFGARMSTSVDASAFAVVGDPIETSGVAFRQLAGRVASINMIERFVNSLKDNPVAGSS